MTTIIDQIINPQSGKAFLVKENQLIKITDLEGQQTGDLFAVASSDPSEYFSAGVTIDCNGNIYLRGYGAALVARAGANELARAKATNLFRTTTSNH